MFTGIVQALGQVAAVEILRRDCGAWAAVLEVETPFQKIKKGESIAVDGVCLTALQARSQKKNWVVRFELSQESLSRTTLRSTKIGQKVNLERALRVGESLGGHWVLGHVDGVGKIQKVIPVNAGESKVFVFSYPPEMRDWILPKGSIAVDGVALTIVDHALEENQFSCSILPYTEEQTTLGKKLPGHSVNLEGDAMVKTIVQTTQHFLAQRKKLS